MDHDVYPHRRSNRLFVAYAAALALMGCASAPAVTAPAVELTDAGARPLPTEPAPASVSTHPPARSRRPCTTTKDCLEGEECWAPQHTTKLACERPCEDDKDCAPTEHCADYTVDLGPKACRPR